MQANLPPKMQAYLLWCEDRGITPTVARAAVKASLIKVTFIGDERSTDSHLDDELLSKMTVAMNLTAGEYAVVNLGDKLDQQTQSFVILGANAAHALLGDNVDFASARGAWHTIYGLPAMITHHPRDLRRQPAYKREAWNDLQAVMQRLSVLPA